MAPDLERESTPEPRPARFGVSWTTLAALALLFVGTGLRLWIAAQNVSSPMIDENEVVEQAVAFMGPDHRYFFLKYGPFTMYALAGIYRVAALLHGSTALDYASQVFLAGDEFYRIARFYTVGWLSVLGWAAFASFRRHFGPSPALLVLALLAFPVLEVLAPGARIDLPQAAFQGLALLALGEAVSTGRLVPWLLAGACAGFAIATKPLPGLLLGPCFLAASWFQARLALDGTRRGWLGRLGAALGSRGMWLAALMVVACALLGNPAMLDVGSFVSSQRQAVALHSGTALRAQHLAIGDIFLRLGLPFVIALLVSATVVVLDRDPRALLPLIFIATYLAAVYGRDARTYFMVAPAAAGCLACGHAWASVRRWMTRALAGDASGLGRWAALERWRMPRRELLERAGDWAWLPLWALIAWPSLAILYRNATRLNPADQARQWIEANIPSGTRLFNVGWRPSGPLLVATNEKLQAKWGDHFDYGRDNYAFLKQAFHLGFERYMASDQPRYSLSVHDDIPYPRASKRTPRRITDGLLAEAQKKKIGYIILSGYREAHWQDLGYRWFGQARLAEEFGKTAIFAVPDPITPSEKPETPPEAAPEQALDEALEPPPARATESPPETGSAAAHEAR